MPKRTDIEKILVIGSGPIVIGQACEFDYSGTQAVKALKKEGYKVILVNSNPATIMTDPEFSDRTYIEPITWEIVEQIIEIERPDALLPTLGGQTSLNVTVELSDNGVLDKYGVELIGAKVDAIKKAEDRELFKKAMEEIGLELPRGGIARTEEEAKKLLDEVPFPIIIRPAFTLGGIGGSIAYNIEEYTEYVKWGLNSSPISEIAVEESVIGWKEFELEVMRDLNDNVVIICSIENFDPMGIHTGDSITVAPVQTLTDMEYQRMRDYSIDVIRKIGVETGGSNIQFAVHPDTGKMIIIEMNPRVSRSSALASKATGYPIAKIAALLSVGYTLDEILNDITGSTPASFEPTIDYVVVKIPRWDFEKFPNADKKLNTQMKAIGEVMSIGKTFKEALQKGICSLENGRFGLGLDGNELDEIVELSEKNRDEQILAIKEKLRFPYPERIYYIRYAMKSGFSIDEIYHLTGIDRWFLTNIKEIIDIEDELQSEAKLKREPSGKLIKKAKSAGFSDRQIGNIFLKDEMSVRDFRMKKKINAVFKMVDTCAAEFESVTPYFYSTYEKENEVRFNDNKKMMILGGGPNRIGQGIEFDYCCVHAVMALKELGYETIMVNSNPETVSTDYDISDKLYFEPLTLENILNIVDYENPDGVIVQFGGQTPLKLALSLKSAGVPIIGTSPESIDLAEDRKKFGNLLNSLNIRYPDYKTATRDEEAIKIAEKIDYPVLVRPSYVLGGRAMEIVYNETDLRYYMINAVKASPEHPVEIIKFLEDAFEFDVDAIADNERTVIGGIMQHIEEAGIHSGDSACVLPPYLISDENLDKIRKYTYTISKFLNVVGLLNIQYAIKDDKLYVLEVNPRASRTVPFVSKTIGIPLAKLAAKVMAGKKLSELGFTEEVKINHISVKESIFPFDKFTEVKNFLGPEMRSTGEVMGISEEFGISFAKSQMSVGMGLPLTGTAFISVNDNDKSRIFSIAKNLSELGFKITATTGTAAFFKKKGIDAELILKVGEGRPNIVDYIKNDEIDLIINTPLGKTSRFDENAIGKNAIQKKIPFITTLSGAEATVKAIESLKKETVKVRALQEYHKEILKDN